MLGHRIPSTISELPKSKVRRRIQFDDNDGDGDGDGGGSGSGSGRRAALHCARSVPRLMKSLTIRVGLTPRTVNRALPGICKEQSVHNREQRRVQRVQMTGKS